MVPQTQAHSKTTGGLLKLVGGTSTTLASTDTLQTGNVIKSSRGYTADTDDTVYDIK